MYSKTMDKLKHAAIRCALSGTNYTKEDLDIHTPEETIIFLKYLSNIANGETYNIRLDFGGSSARMKSNAKHYINAVFKEYNKLDSRVLNIIENLKQIDDAVEEPFGFSPRELDHYTARIGYVTAISGKEESETMNVALIVHLMDAEKKGQLESAMRNLTEFLYINDESNKSLVGFREFAGLMTQKEGYISNADLLFAPFIKKYQAVVDGYTDKLSEPESPKEDAYYRSDLRVYRSEYERYINLMNQVISTGNINMRDRYNNTLLHISMYEKDAEFANVIIKLGVDMDLENCNDLRAIEYLTNTTWKTDENKQKQAAILETMFEHNVNISFKSLRETCIDLLLKEAENNPLLKPLLDKYVPDTNRVSALTSVFG